MGAKLSLLAPSAPTIAISSYIDILNSIQYIEVVNNSRFLKTIKAIDQKSGCLIVIKILIKPSNASYTLNLQDVTELIVKESSLLAAASTDSKKLSNVLPWSNIIETDRAGYLIRQHCKTNLYDRLSIRPFLQPIEKLFLMYQMLKTIDELHQLKIHHGDLRLENFLVTSWNWLMLTDFASYIKPTYIPEDNPNQFSFFFDSSDRRVCYLAPERFYNSSTTKASKLINNYDEEGKFVGKDTVTNAMDYFSLGCVIAELFLEGDAIFTLSSLFKYIKGEYIPDLSRIQPPGVREIITKLISIDPKDRPSSCHSILEDYKGTLFPDFFDGFLYDFMAEINSNELFIVPTGNDNISPSDLKIDFIYANFDKISKNLNYQYKEDVGVDGNDEEILPLRLSLPGMPPHYKIKSTEELGNTQGDESSLIIINVVYSLIKSLKRPSSKLKACELILALSERINDECKLDRSLPYLCFLLDEYLETSSTNNFASISVESTENSGVVYSEGASSNIAAFALKSISTLLLSCSSITPLNALIFPQYLIPKLTALLKSPHMHKEEKIFIKIAIAHCLPCLANCAKKFWLLSKDFKNNSMSPTALENPSQDDEYNTFNMSRDRLDSDFEILTSTILSDSNSLVKLNLISNILPLCQFFGIEKTNNLILPHILTFLNDSDTKLRLAFLDCLLTLGPIIGVLSFEQYLLPLLIQTLCDSELFVILKVLEIFNKVIKDKLINPKSEFNALSVYNEILTNCLHLVLHPNEWVRQSVLNIILSVSDNLSNADRYCFLFPLIKTYLSYDIARFDWNVLYPCLTRPVTKPVFDLAVTWSLNATNKSLFWSLSASKEINLAHNLKNANSSYLHATSLGMSVYAPSADVVFKNSNGKNSTVPLSPEDKQWLFKLKSVGLEHKDLWKIFMLRNFIYTYSKKRSVASNLAQGSKFELINHADLIPRNIFFELCYKSEPIAKTSTSETKYYPTSGKDESDISNNGNDHILANSGEVVGRRESNSLVLPNFGRVKASVQTVQANVFGELESSSHEATGLGNHSHHHHVHSTKDVNSTHKVFSVNNHNVITANMRHSYTGNNPFMLNYLNSIEFKPSFKSFSEFGPIIRKKRGSVSKRTSEGGDPFEEHTNILKGTCISQINTNTTIDIDSINALAICDSSEFFVTGSDSGLLRIWDITKLERNTMAKSANLILNLDSSITCIKFIPKRYAFAVSTEDGFVRIYKVEVSRGNSKNQSQSNKILKYTKCVLIREFQLNVSESGYCLSLDYMINDNNAVLIGVTSSSKIVGFDILKMEKVLDLQNSLFLGIPSTFIVDSTYCWLLLGTNKGNLCLWDLRFEMLLRSWSVNTGRDDIEGGEGISKVSSPIKKLVGIVGNNIKKQHSHLQKDSKSDNNATFTAFAMIGGTGNSDVSVWDIPSFTCRQVFSSQTPNPRVKLYNLEQTDVSIDTEISKLVLDVDLDFDLNVRHVDPSMTYLGAVHMGTSEEELLVTATADKRIIVWDIQDPEKSMSLNSEDESVHFTNNIVNSSLSLINERFFKRDALSSATNTTTPEVIPRHQDVITGIELCQAPTRLLISTDRNGFIHLYQ
ncbi:serine/threonine-protein kinase Vps15p [[Candida] railenensis]|uniref:non-specific serine/threonine protein kinase n=1 Tax=[Candida] railenensis TaxID=45579 RepID=A0A9P0VVL7_9ASCO|nr:serine/threonine-protein kinase Vps15p [[Candida] railenensis]